MIKVVVADYCQNCPRFEAAVGKTKLYIGKDAQGETEQYADTEIRCANASNCAAIEANLRKKIENESPRPEPEAAKTTEKQESKWAKWWKRLADRLRWIDVWDVLTAAAIVLATTAVIFVALLLALLIAAIIRGSLRI